MSRPQAEEPCLPVFSVLTADIDKLNRALQKLHPRWPKLRTMAPPFVFHETSYYEDEMGSGLLRWWGYRHCLENPADLMDWKQTSRDIEQMFVNSEGNRTVNIDPGYLNYGLFVLASYKYDLQKIAIGNGVYADPILAFGQGDFQPFEWSFPDFKKPDYYSVFKEFRRRYKSLRSQKRRGR